jgi:thiamine-phosphate pyrophosphorylase
MLIPSAGYPPGMRLYAITDRQLLPGVHEPGRLSREELDGLMRLAETWCAAGVDYIQIREKDLQTPDLITLAQALIGSIRCADTRTQLLINAGAPGAAEAARAAGAAGLHLPGRWHAEQVGWARALGIVSVGCHSLGEIAVARAARSDLALLSPIFKTASHPEAPPLGLEVLAEACRIADGIPVLALGGVTAENAALCIAAGAAGIAGIRMFVEERWPGAPVPDPR